MAQPFVISIKAYLDAQGIKAGSKEAERALIALNRTATSAHTKLQSQINGTVGVAGNRRAFHEAQTDIKAYGRSLDELRSRYNPVFAAHQRYRQSLTGIRQAHKVGAISTDEMTGAIQRERSAALASIAALKGRTGALNSMNAASGRLNWQQRNLMFQLVDVGQMMALQQPLHILAMQQGPQIAQIYGPGEGGIGRAFKESTSLVGRFVSKFAKIGGVIGLGVGALAGFAHELDKTTEKSVGMGDAFVASFQVIGDRLYDAYIKPAEDQISGFFKWLWDGTIWLTKTLINMVVVTVGSAGLAVEYAGLALWATVKSLGANIQNFFVDALHNISSFIVDGFNVLIENVNALLENIGAKGAAELFGFSGQFDLVAKSDFSGMRATYSDFEAEISSLNDTYGEAFDNLFTEDHAGNFFDAVSDRAISNLNEVDEEATKAAARLKAAYDRIISSTQQRIDGLLLEQKTLGMTTEAANRMRYAQDLMNQATRAGIDLTPQQIAQLQDLAGTLAAVEAETKALKDAYEFSKQVFTSFFSDFRSELTEGKSLWEAFASAGSKALDTIADKALSMAAEGIFDLIFSAFTGANSSGGSDIFGTIIGALFGGIGGNAKGTDFWRGGLSWVGENGPEIVNLPRGSKVIPNNEIKAMASSSFSPGLAAANQNNPSAANQNGMTIHFENHVNMTGSGGSVQDFKRALDENNKYIKGQLPGWFREAQKRAYI